MTQNLMQSLNDIPNPTPEEIEACLAEARRQRSLHFGIVLSSIGRSLARPFRQTERKAKRVRGGVAHST